MKRLYFFFLVAFFFIASGCSTLKSTRVFTPETFGMEKISEKIYVDKDMSDTLRLDLKESYKDARQRVVHVYGGIHSNPDVIACSTEKCFQKFGGITARAVSFGSTAFLLSPRGLTPEIISHEWSHNELYVRIDSFLKWRKIPQWFDGGLAVVVSNEPTHSQAAWDEIRRSNVPVPTLDELVTLKDWHKAIKKYGEYKSTENNPEKLRVVYATAGNEIRQWYRATGQKGLQDLIRAVKSGEHFSDIYLYDE